MLAGKCSEAVVADIASETEVDYLIRTIVDRFGEINVCLEADQ